MKAGVVEQVLAAGVLLVCVGLFVRLLLSPSRRRVVDLAVRHAWGALRQYWERIRHGRRAQVRASRLAEDAIRQAQRRARDVSPDGKVVRPKAFERTPPKR